MQEAFRLCRQVAMHEHLAGLIDDADVHGVSVQIDAAVEFVLLLVASHHGSSSLGRVEPGSWLEGDTPPETATWSRTNVFKLANHGTTSSNKEAMMSINREHRSTRVGRIKWTA